MGAPAVGEGDAGAPASGAQGGAEARAAGEREARASLRAEAEEARGKFAEEHRAKVDRRKAANREAQARELEAGTGAFTAAAGASRSGAESWSIVSDLVGPVPKTKEDSKEGKAYQASLIVRLKHQGAGETVPAESPASAPEPDVSLHEPAPLGD